ncbi:MAG: hypothetical protein HKO54_05885, partial [Flavobacteriaceae bacterium]|nr:hypothetical protein [Flavobacteriaceae bacterium]
MLRLTILLTTLIFTFSLGIAQTTPAPPISITGKGSKTNYSSQDYKIPGNGKVIYQYWETMFEGPQYIWIIKQVHMVITPPDKSDIEDTFIWLEEPHSKCDLMDWQPKLNSPGQTFALAVNLDSSPGVNIGAEGRTGVDGVEIESAPGRKPLDDAGFWRVDWDDFSDAAETKATLDFYAKWRCPKNCGCSLIGDQTAKSSIILIEFDVSGIDPEYTLMDGKTRTRAQIKKEKEEKKKKTKTASAWTPSSGATKIAAVGTVRDENVTMTARGSIGGTVIVENEEGQEIAAVEPDENGRFEIDFGDLAVLTGATTLLLNQQDAEGNSLSTTSIEYEPGTPSSWAGPPVITPPEVVYIQNHQLVEITGSNLGDAVEVLVDGSQGE